MAELNLISDPWIRVLRHSGRDVIRPDQIAEGDVLRPDWPRPDLNLACYELLIGLVHLAHPPATTDDRSTLPDTADLRASMASLVPAFNLLGDGPRFLQDLEPLEDKARPPEMLFIDSAGDNAVNKNADLMVRRGRYDTLPLPLAAMALYTLQAFAPAGGRGNCTSMRGGGPMVTLVKPVEQGLWPLVWANVPRGNPLTEDQLSALPWMRPTETSEPVNGKRRISVPPSDDPSRAAAEIFFGQPRRLRLIAEDGAVTGVVQRPWGTNYTGWRHPLTPYYRKGTDLLPCHPRPGRFGYRNWRGVILKSETGLRPEALEQYMRDIEGPNCSLIVAGWAMRNMMPRDFIWSEQPVFPLSDEQEYDAENSVEAAEQSGYALAACVQEAVGESKLASGAGHNAREAFFSATQLPFEAMLASISAGHPFSAQRWVDTMRTAALPIFDAQALPGLADLGETRRRQAVSARAKLLSAFAGHPPFGKRIFDPIGLKTVRRSPEGNGGDS